MQDFLEEIKTIDSIQDAISSLENSIFLSDKINEALQFCIEAHSSQKRKSGEPYVVHPILVASITAYFSKDEAMVLSALLHDIVEDTKYDISYIKNNYGDDVAHIVDGLTKITELKHGEIENTYNKSQKSALTFRKMIIASTDDVRVLVVKLFDRTHNMLTLDALSVEKQKRIAEETLVVYAPISHRLGMSAIKNILEDLSFYYLYPEEYNKIDMHIQSHQETMQNTFDNFVNDITELLNPNQKQNIKIFSRIKHYYSIYLKTQRKGVNIDEVLDLFAVRIITNTPLDCYKTLGKIHTQYRPLIARFKDYVAIPKENGYQTIHTTVFRKAKIFEIQIRTNNMHKVAEFGVAAHWKYKDGSNDKVKPNLSWLHTLEVHHEDVEEFYDDTKQDLFSEEIVVYSPNGDIFTLPRGSTAFDFAYMIHTDIGNKAKYCYINTIQKPLLSELKSGDIVSVSLNDKITPRCSWYEIVKTTKAKKSIKLLCQNRIRQIDELNGKNIVNTLFYKYKYNILNFVTITKIQNISSSYEYLKDVKKQILNSINENTNFLTRLKLLNMNIKEYTFDNIILKSNFSINEISFDHCCHPKQGDEILAFKNNKNVIIHHKMCDSAYNKMKENKQMIFCKWSGDKYFSYKTVLSIQHKRGELARLLNHLSNNEAIIISIDFRRDESSHVQYCKLDMQIKNNNLEEVKKILEKKAKIIECYSSIDAYK